MAKRMRSDAKLKERYPMTNNCFYKIWRGQEVSMVEWYQPVSESITSLRQDLPISELPSKLCLPSIDHTSSTEETSITGNSNQINISNKQIKKRKLRSKSVRIFDSPNSEVSAKVHITSGGGIPNILTEKVENSDLYTLIEYNRKETEEAE
ncbi:17164_t:CDS:2, partial [Cetraspora pellucida]